MTQLTRRDALSRLARPHRHAATASPARHAGRARSRSVASAGQPSASASSAAPASGSSSAPASASSSAPATLNPAMVDRMFWRVGFGPSAADRARWTGRPVSALIDFFLTTPYALAPGPSPTIDGQPINPTRSLAELQLEWLDRMKRVTNPFIERLTFFWHRHFAVSSAFGISYPLLMAYRDRLRKYADLAANPSACFRDLALEMTTQDQAMSVWLNLCQNRKAHPNENYAREFMELFTLGLTDDNGNPNYTQTDITQLTRAFTGYRIIDGTLQYRPTQFDSGQKTIFGQTANFGAAEAVDLVLSQPNHGHFLARKLWSEFIAAPIPADTESELVSAYVGSGYQLAPLLRGILSHPLIFDSLEEPTMIKPPVIYTVGVTRTLDVPLVVGVQPAALWRMAQLPYHPPNVAGWEGGLSWLNTSTALARFALIPASQALLPAPEDVPGESAAAALDRVYRDCGSPWQSAPTWKYLSWVAGQLPSSSATARRGRYYTLACLILGGPDGQVM